MGPLPRSPIYSYVFVQMELGNLVNPRSVDSCVHLPHPRAESAKRADPQAMSISDSQSLTNNIEPMTRSAITANRKLAALDALCVMDHPQRLAADRELWF